MQFQCPPKIINNLMRTHGASVRLPLLFAPLSSTYSCLACPLADPSPLTFSSINTLSQFPRHSSRMPPTKSLRPAGPALTPSATTLTILTDPSLSNPYVPQTFSDGLPVPRIMVFDLDYTLWPFWCDTHVTPPVKSLKESSLTKKDKEENAMLAQGLALTNNKMVDRWGEHFSFYAEVPGVLAACRERGIVMGLASRTHTPDIARDLLRGLTVPVYPPKDGTGSEKKASDKKSKGTSANNGVRAVKAIDFFPQPLQQIYPGTKTNHFRKIHEASGQGKAVAQIPELKRYVAAGGMSGVGYEEMLFFDDEARNRNVETELGVTFWLVRDGVSAQEVDRGVWEWRKRRGIGRKASGDTVNNGAGWKELEG